MLRKILLALMLAPLSKQTTVQYKNKIVHIDHSQIHKVLEARLQSSGLKLTAQQMEDIIRVTETLMIEYYSYFLQNADAALKDKKFMQEVLSQVVLLWIEHQVRNEHVTIAQAKEFYEKKLAAVKVPEQFKIKIAAFDSQARADKALKALQAGSEFDRIFKGSINANEDGLLLNTETKQPFVHILYPALPRELKPVLQANPAIGVNEQVIPVQIGAQTQYWIINVISKRPGSKADMPAFNANDHVFVQNVKNLVARDKFEQTAKDSVKNVTVTRAE